MSRLGLWLGWAVIFLCAPGCAALDGFLYAPVPVGDDVDLFAATRIPAELRYEARYEVQAADGTVVNTWLLHHDEGHPFDNSPQARHGTTLLYCHGNNRNLAAFARRIEALWTLGYTVAAFDYRGYGKTRGRPSEAGLYQDVRAVADWLRARGVDDDRLALYGYSLGAAVCAQLAVERQPKALVLEAPFASVDVLAKDASGIGLPRDFFVHASYDTVGKLPHFAGALTIFHGARDTYLRPAYGEQLARAAAGHARSVDFALVPGADHETVPCRDKYAPRPSPGDCVEGFDPAYLSRLAGAIDGAILPATADDTQR